MDVDNGMLARLRGGSPGSSRDQPFGIDAACHRLELGHLWSKDRVLVGNDCAIPGAGNTFTGDVGGHAVVVRGEDGRIAAWCLSPAAI